MAAPSIKGTAFEGAVADVCALVEAGRLKREELEVRLRPDDLELIDQKVAAGFWYPMESYLRLLELLVELEAQGDRTGYLRGRGQRAMTRLLGSGIYQQFEAMRHGWEEWVGRLMVSLSGSIYNFGQWSFVSDDESEDSFEIHVRDAAALPEAVQLTVEGAVGLLAERVAAGPVTVSSDRPRPDEIHFRVRRDD